MDDEHPTVPLDELLSSIEEVNETIVEPEVAILACPQLHETATDIDNKCQQCGAVLMEVYR